MKRILLCGSTGFMGQNIFDYFLSRKDEYEIFPTSKPQFDLTVNEDVKKLFELYKPDIVIQAAATTSGAKDIIERPYIHVADNAVMNSLLLRASYDYNIEQFIFLSCGVMYQPGNVWRKETDYNESDKIFPSYFGIGWTKVYIEKMMEFYSSLGRTKYLAIRHSNTYGPYDKFESAGAHVLAATIKKVFDATDKITVWGNGTDTARDLIYVDDVVKFIDTAIKKQTIPFDIVNVSAGKFITVKELVEKIVEISGKKISIEYDNSKPSIPTKLCLNNTKAYESYGWLPETSLEEGLKQTIDWYKTEIT